jgi:hypothetical protein
VTPPPVRRLRFVQDVDRGLAVLSWNLDASLWSLRLLRKVNWCEPCGRRMPRRTPAWGPIGAPYRHLRICEACVDRARERGPHD